MSNRTLLVSVGLAFVGFLFRLAEVFFGAPDIAFYVYLLLVLIAIFFGLREINTTEFKVLFKGAMKPAAIFVVLVGLLQFVYYTKINPGYFDERIAERLAEAEANNYSKEEIIALGKNLQQIFNASVISTFQLFALLFISLLYGAVSTYIFIKIKVFRTF